MQNIGEELKKNLLLPESNNTNFPLAIQNNLSQLQYDEKYFLKYHQFIIKEYFTRNPQNRGLLMYHAMGMGKTILAISIANYYRELDPARRIIVLLPKSLEDNFREEIKLYMREFIKFKSQQETISVTETEMDSIIDSDYRFVSLNASNMYKQMETVDQTKEEKAYLKKLGTIVEHGKFHSLENSLLVVDEAHNLFNSITNGASNGVALYDLIMNTHNIKLIFLTGTPIRNDPHELVCAFNMLKGQIKDKIQHTLFSEDRAEFYNYFVDESHGKIKNIDKFKNRIYGLTSYYGDLYRNDDGVDSDDTIVADKKKSKTKVVPRTKDTKGFPEKLPLIIRKVHMSGEQYSKYGLARDLEREESAFSHKGSGGRFNAKSGSSTYRIKSRQICNYLFPEHALGPIRGHKMREKFVNKIGDSIMNLEVYSPKILSLLSDLRLYLDYPCFIYSQFVRGEGIEVMSKILLTLGYQQYAVGEKFNLDSSNTGDTDETSGLTDIEITGKYDDSMYTLITGGSKKEKPTKKKSAKDKSEKHTQHKSTNSNDQHHDTYAPTKESSLSSAEIKKIYLQENKKTPRKFAILSGNVSMEDRAQILKVFNSPQNMYGEQIQLLLISGAVSEGINLKCVRATFLLEPFFNDARISQVIGRAVRYLSHETLPPDERTVQPYIYLSTYPRNFDKSHIDELTTDEYLFSTAHHRKKIIDEFLHCLIETSIDCSLHHKKLSSRLKEKIKCLMCAPTNVQLYHPSIHKDILLANPCQSLQATQLKLKKVIIDDNTYYYNSDDKLKIYMYSDELGGYKVMPQSHPDHSKVIEKLFDK